MKIQRFMPFEKPERIMRQIRLGVILSLFALSTGIVSNVQAQTVQKEYLSGTGMDHTVQWSFYCTQGRNSGKWTQIAVPSCWELQGFGSYHYGLYEPFDSLRNEKGIYKYQFNVPEKWKNKKVYIVFGGSATDTKVKINGNLAGPIHQGAFYQFKYDITKLIKFGGNNELKATVSKISSDDSVNMAERRADYWVFGGIYRPVYLEAFPKTFIKRIALNAQANGDFLVNTFLDNVKRGDRIKAQIVNAKGEKVGPSFSQRLKRGQNKVTLRTHIDHPKTWSPEFPHLYRVDIQLMKRRHPIYKMSQKFGFRTIEIRKGKGLFLNGHRIMMKGVCRHSFWPSSGWATDKEINIHDVNLIKDMNMNAVRTAHSPPDVSFLNACDSLGVLVLDELGGWHNWYDTKLGKKLVRGFVTRDVNHPSIIFWDNGNEGGWNTALDDQYDLYDPQNRVVTHPGTRYPPDRPFNGVIDHHYQDYAGVKKELQRPYLYFPTEFLHGLYAGGSGADLYDYWKLMRSSPVSGGGFLWDLTDEGVVRTDKGDHVDVEGNKAPDGMVGPFRHAKEGSYYAIKQIWSPVQITKPDLNNSFNGRLSVQNRFYFTNLNQCHFTWQLVDYPKVSQKLKGYKVASQGSIPAPNVSPQQNGKLQIDLPSRWYKHDALFVKAVDPHGREIYQWTWMISNPQKVRKADITLNSSKKANAIQKPNSILLEGGNTRIDISKKTGNIIHITHNGLPVLFDNGPCLLGKSKASFFSIKSYADGNQQVVDVHFKNDKKWIKYTMYGDGWLQMDYQYQPTQGKHPYLGITFSYPPNKVNAIKYLGKGPHRVWKNRMRGTTFNVWSNQYNNTRTGQQWNYPEFKGYFANLYWAKIKTSEQPITVVTDTKNIFLRLLTPQYGVNPRHTKVKFPKGNISFLQVINPIGTKFHAPNELGPAGHLYKVPENSKPYKGTLYFRFGE